MEDLDAYIFGDFYVWCKQQKVMPRNKRDEAILRKAFKEGFTGRKLYKAKYKVRYPEKYAAEKARWKSKQKKT